jgi:hypothetical protein
MVLLSGNWQLLEFAMNILVGTYPDLRSLRWNNSPPKRVCFHQRRAFQTEVRGMLKPLTTYLLWF